ncbi:MAG: hypothetical protein K8W52_36690 [Deltaproteobacteria bacterium]|nr:hypothetical protein [Deltaproteobacteria bacterium]
MISAIAVGLLAACTGGSPPAPAAAPIATAPAPAVAALIDIRPITINFRGQPIARLFADGRTEAVGNNPPGGAMSPGPTLHADGTIQLTKGGRTARVTTDGEIVVASPGGKEAPFGRIVGDHLTLGEAPAGVHADGDMLVFDNGRDDVGQIVGPVDAGMRRTALVMTAAFFADSAP